MRSIWLWMSFGVTWVETSAMAETFPLSVVSKLGDSVLVEAEVVGQLVEHGDADLVTKLVGVGERLLERNAVDRDRVGRHSGHVTALGERDPVVEAEQFGILRI